MLDHHLQRSIVYRLAFSPSLRFSNLKPDSVENKLFDYHLKKVISAGLIEKLPSGEYALTPEGRRLGKRALDKQLAVADRAEPVLFLAIRHSNGDWLLYRRRVHPLLGCVGFMHANPVAGKSVEEIARQVCLEKTGIVASFRVLGSGLFETYEGDNLESYTDFTFLVSDDASGELAQNDDYAEYYWATKPDFSSIDMLPNMKTLGNLHKADKLFFVQKTFRL